MTRPVKLWVLKYRLRASIQYVVVLTVDEALEMEAKILLSDGKDVEIWPCSVRQ